MIALPGGSPSLRRLLVMGGVSLAHVLVLAWALSGLHFASKAVPPPDRVIDVVDIREFVPLVPPKLTPPPPPPPQPQKIEPVADKLPEKLEPATTDSVMPVATDPTPSPPALPPAPPAEPVYVPQSKIAEVPLLPTKEILGRIKYPALAAKMELEATVFLELFIDDTGVVRKVTVLKDPGHGFAEAAVAALLNVHGSPAKDADGHAVAVRFRYPVRFTLK